MKKILLSLLLSISAALSSHAYILFQDSTNYPYTNGCIEGQGQWYCYSPSTPAGDADVTNNVLYLNTTNKDSVATPTNGFYAATNGTLTVASFTINVSQLPQNYYGTYFYEFQDQSNNTCCHLFIDTIGTQVPGSYRLGIANFGTSFFQTQPPINYPMDLATGVTYTVVCSFDTDPDAITAGAQLWIDPSGTDFTNDLDDLYYGDGIGVGYVYATDKVTGSTVVPNISQVAFSPYVNAGISNVLVGTTFADVLSTNPPVFGLQPQSQTNYSDNTAIFYSIAAGSDLTYQWFSTTHGMLTDDGVNIIGSTNNILTINNLSASDDYYVVATDAYGDQITSAIATNTVITTPTPVFFPTSEVPLALTNNLFTTSGFTNVALGTGPITYQWFFAPTNTPNTYSPLPGQQSSGLNLVLGDFTYQGNYYVAAYNSINGGSVAYGPTNSLIELAPLQATLTQLHNYELANYSQVLANKTTSFYIFTNNLVVSGYVTTYGGFGSAYSSPPYTEFYMQDTNGVGTEVYLGNNSNTNTPPIGSYVTVTGPLEIYHTGLEMAAATISAIVVTPGPVVPLQPVVQNANFNNLVTNALSTNALLASCSLMTFTNVYLYGSKTGAAIGHGGIFYSNSYSTAYFTIGGPYSTVTHNTNVMEIFQPGYDYGDPTVTTPVLNPFDNQTVPTHCYQLTGAYIAYGGTAEISPSRLADYVVNVPSELSVIAVTNKLVTLKWSNQVGSTYSVYGATNLAGPWVTKAYGLNYFPTNTMYMETNSAGTQFYKVTSP